MENGLARIKHSKQVSKMKSDVDMTMPRAKDESEGVATHMRRKDSSGVTTYIVFEETTVAEISMVQRNFGLGVPMARDKNRTAVGFWVAPTMVLSIVSGCDVHCTDLWYYISSFY